jgi:hypothetical protein
MAVITQFLEARWGALRLGIEHGLVIQHWRGKSSQQSAWRTPARRNYPSRRTDWAVY